MYALTRSRQVPRPAAVAANAQTRGSAVSLSPDGPCVTPCPAGRVLKGRPGSLSDPAWGLIMGQRGRPHRRWQPPRHHRAAPKGPGGPGGCHSTTSVRQVLEELSLSFKINYCQYYAIEEHSKTSGKKGSGRRVLFSFGYIFCFHAIRRSGRTVRNLAAKALIAAARPLAGTISSGSLAAKALIAAARA